LVVEEVDVAMTLADYLFAGGLFVLLFSAITILLVRRKS
jgi:hypothetical protein